MKSSLALDGVLPRRRMLLGLAGALACALASSSVGVVVTACRRDGADPPDRGKILSDLSAKVMVPAYADAAVDAKALEASLTTLKGAPTADALNGARAAWKKARASWKITDAFLFGPADDLALTGGVIDTAPDVVKLEALAAPATTTALDATAISALGANQRGFGALETMLFDPAKDDAAMLAAFQSADGRRGTLAALLATDLRTKVEAVRDAWSSPPTSYGEQLATAGRGSTVYSSERQGVDAVVNALLSAVEVVISLRLAKPLGLDKTPAVAAPELVESNRSDASIDDMLAVLEGVQRVYLGRSGGLPLADAVAERSPSADEHMRANVDKAIAAIKQIQGPLREAVALRRDPVIAAHAAVRAIKTSIATEVAGALGTSIGIGVTDGD